VEQKLLQTSVVEMIKSLDLHSVFFDVPSKVTQFFLGFVLVKNEIQ
jgi:hypothetical protein